MIRIGFNEEEKQRILNAYIGANDIRKVFIFYHKRIGQTMEISCEHEFVEWDSLIMYKYFYRLLEEIDDNCLIVIDELMRTQNRSELTYNCVHHYLNQTKHRIIFEYFPFIEKENDFMILLDFENKDKYKGKGFDEVFLKEEDIQIKHNPIAFNTITIPNNGKITARYQKEKEKLFVNLGMKDPDTLPRNLHVFVGNFKKAYIDPSKKYIARNQRFKRDNVATYQQNPSDERIVIDFHYRRLNFNDYLKRSRAKNITFLTSNLPVDNYYETEFRKWLERVKEFAKTSISTN